MNQLEALYLLIEAPYKPYRIDSQLQEMQLLNLKPQTSLSFVVLKLKFDHYSSIVFCYHLALYS
jgi:hypothetical protein